MIYLFYTTYISVVVAHHEIFNAKYGKGGINMVYIFYTTYISVVVAH